MSQITIIQDDGVVGVDGVFRSVDLSELDASIHAVQYDDVARVGHIEFDANLDPRPANQPLGKTLFEKRFNRFLKLWRAAGQPPVRTPEQIAADAAAQAQALVDTQATADAKSDAVIQYLVNHTPAQCAAYVQNNVTSLATAKDLLAKMAMALSVLARQHLR